MTADAWQPVDFLAEFRERETCLREVTELLKEKAQCETGKLWAHHLPFIVDALGFFQGLLQDEIDHFGEWRYHEFQPDEVLDFIDEDLDKLAIWLCRMTNTSLPNGANGMSDMEGKMTRVGASEWSRGDASDIDGQTDRSNGAFGKSDIEGKAAKVAARERGKRTSFKWAGAHESMRAANEFQIIKTSKPPSPQFAAVTRVKERPGFPIATDLKR
jgi:hypothetical protein